MTNFFDLLNFRREPFIETVDVKDRFAELSGPVHPDRVHQSDDTTRRNANDRYAELNSACQTLSDTRLRLKYLIELETGESPSDVGAVPAHISDLFFKVGGAFRVADAIISEREEESPPMVRVQIMRRALASAEDLKTLQETLTDEVDELDARCRQLNEQWVSSASKPVNKITMLYRNYSYLDKWLAQTREKQLQLTL